MSKKEITTLDENQLIAVLQSSLYPGAQRGSVELVIDYCRASGLDPMQKPVHIVPMWDKALKQMRDVIMPGIGMYRTQAARSGQYAGVSEPEFGPDVTEKMDGKEVTFPSWCRVTVKRILDSGHVAEFTGFERWKENYATAAKDTSAPNSMWFKRPYGQLAKCAEAQALRKAFPEFGSQPTAEEMEGKLIDMGQAEIVVGSTQESEKKPYPQDRFEANLPKWGKSFEKPNNTAEGMITLIEREHILTDDQKKQIRDADPKTKKNEDVDFVDSYNEAENGE
jgi:phage recombination protein Bet